MFAKNRSVTSFLLRLFSILIVTKMSLVDSKGWINSIDSMRMYAQRRTELIAFSFSISLEIVGTEE